MSCDFMKIRGHEIADRHRGSLSTHCLVGGTDLGGGEGWRGEEIGEEEEREGGEAQIDL